MQKCLFLLGLIGGIRLLNLKASFFSARFKKLIHWIHAVTFELIAILFTFFLRPVGYFRNQDQFAGASSGRPILLVHGYLHDSSAWIYIRKKLSEKGLGPIYTLNLMHPFHSIRAHAETVQQKARKIASQTNRKDLILIGHSMGGLVSSWYAAKLAPAGTVTDVINIGSPLGGTHVAAIALGADGREMRLNSPFVQELQREIERNEHTRFCYMGTRTDQLVIPSSSCWIGDDPLRQFIVDDLGHLSLLLSPRISDKICDWLS